jgi:hypothetical protein
MPSMISSPYSPRPIKQHEWCQTPRPRPARYIRNTAAVKNPRCRYATYGSDTLTAPTRARHVRARALFATLQVPHSVACNGRNGIEIGAERWYSLFIEFRCMGLSIRNESATLSCFPMKRLRQEYCPDRIQICQVCG